MLMKQKTQLHYSNVIVRDKNELNNVLSSKKHLSLPQPLYMYMGMITNNDSMFGQKI